MSAYKIQTLGNYPQESIQILSYFNRLSLTKIKTDILTNNFIIILYILSIV